MALWRDIIWFHVAVNFLRQRLLTIVDSNTAFSLVPSCSIPPSSKYIYKMGKVHGSLARAGKVKGQTPKVEAAEDKKKMPRGRAKKRLQYNRRYVNVVTGMGGKRVGPNSNADKMK
jgi:small subunit ribosomal protein S30e